MCCRFGDVSNNLEHGQDKEYLWSSFMKQTCSAGNLVSMYSFFLDAAGLWLLSQQKHHQLLLSVNFIYVFQILVLHSLSCSHIPDLVVSPRTVLGEPVGDGHGEAEQTQADAVHL